MTRADKNQEIHEKHIFIPVTVPESVQSDKSGLREASVSLCCQVAGAVGLVCCWTPLNEHTFKYYICSHKWCPAPSPTLDHSQIQIMTLILFCLKIWSAVTAGREVQSQNGQYMSMPIILGNTATFFPDPKPDGLYPTTQVLRQRFSRKKHVVYPGTCRLMLAAQGVKLMCVNPTHRSKPHTWLVPYFTSSDYSATAPCLLSCNSWHQIIQDAAKINPGRCNHVFRTGKLEEGKAVPAGWKVEVNTQLALG